MRQEMLILFLKRLTAAVLLFVTISGCWEEPVCFRIIQKSLELEEDHEAFISWEIPRDLESMDYGIEVLCGTKSREYEYSFDAGRSTYFLFPPILEGPRRWYFTARAYDRSGKLEKSEYANEVSKISWR